MTSKYLKMSGACNKNVDTKQKGGRRTERGACVI